MVWYLLLVGPYNIHKEQTFKIHLNTNQYEKSSRYIKTLRNLYIKVVYQFLIYRVEVWGNAHDKLLNYKKGMHSLLHFLVI